MAEKNKNREGLNIYAGMRFLEKGEDFLAEAGFSEEVIEKAISQMTENVAKATAELLGLSDYRPLLKSDTRTEEQGKLMLNLQESIKAKSLEIYLASDYHKTEQAIWSEAIRVITKPLLEELKIKSPEKWEQCQRDLFPPMPEQQEVQRSFVADFAEDFAEGFLRDDLYSEFLENKQIDRSDIESAYTWINVSFYVKHKELNPKASGAVTEAHLEELRQTVREFLQYCEEHGGDFEKNVQAFLEDPLRAQVEEKITEIVQDDSFFQPMSKAWGWQGIISQYGDNGFDLNVGKKTESGKLYIKT